nr:CDP-alcohol phosphatidyltransferase family protein [Rhizobium sp. TCK]
MMWSKEASAIRISAAAAGPSHALRVNALAVLGGVFLGAIVAYSAISFHLSLGSATVIAAAVLLLVIFALVIGSLHRHRFDSFGLANTVTAIRSAIVSLVAAAVIVPNAPENASWALVLLVTVALTLDGFDGYLARLQRQESELGARFDMEVDAFLILCLSAAVFILDKAGAWVLLIGLLRYAFMMAQYFVPSLTAPLPPSLRRKFVCVVQVAALCLILVPGVMAPISVWLAAVALLLLIYSFAVDCLYLLRDPEVGR